VCRPAAKMFPVCINMKTARIIPFLGTFGKLRKSDY